MKSLLIRIFDYLCVWQEEKAKRVSEDIESNPASAYYI